MWQKQEFEIILSDGSRVTVKEHYKRMAERHTMHLPEVDSSLVLALSIALFVIGILVIIYYRKTLWESISDSASSFRSN